MSADLFAPQAFVHIFLCFHTYLLGYFNYFVKKGKTLPGTAVHKRTCMHAILDGNRKAQVCVFLCYSSEHPVQLQCLIG